jgi:hypothetical protein
MLKNDSSIKAFDFGSQIKEKTNLGNIIAANLEEKKLVLENSNSILEPSNPVISFEPEKITVKATNFTNNINKLFEAEKDEVVSKKTDENEVKNEYEGLPYKKVVELEAKKFQKQYFAELISFEHMIIKQSIAKIIINPELKKLSVQGQTIIKTFFDNLNVLSYHLDQFLKEDQEKLVEFLYNYNSSVKDSRLVPQKIKDFNTLFFKLLQTIF